MTNSQLNETDLKEVAGGNGELIDGLDPYPNGSEFKKYVTGDDILYIHVTGHYVQRNQYVYICDSYKVNRFTGSKHDSRETRIGHDALRDLYKRTK